MQSSTAFAQHSAWQLVGSRFDMENNKEVEG
jgi:hypothetical protein